MRSSQIQEVLTKQYFRRRPVMIWGSPGVGKTDTVFQTGAKIEALLRAKKVMKAKDKFRVVDFRLAMRDPTALMGFPMPNDDTRTMMFYRDNELPTDGFGILFLDEINSAAQATQAAAMQLTLTGKIGDYVLPPGWSVVACGNREQDRSVVHRMPAALSLRLLHLDFEVNLDDWCDWAMDNDISTDIISFIRFRPNLLDAFDPNARSSPNPRGWQFCDEVYKDNMDADIEMEAYKGYVGEGAASELIGFLSQIKDLPSIDKILLAPDKVEVPTAPATQYALSTAMAVRASDNNMDRLMTYVERMPIEMQVLFCRDAVRRDGKTANTKAFTLWSTKNSKVMS